MQVWESEDALKENNFQESTKGHEEQGHEDEKTTSPL